MRISIGKVRVEPDHRQQLLNAVLLLLARRQVVYLKWLANDAANRHTWV